MAQGFLAFTLMLGVLAGSACAEEQITLCIDHHPPNHMFPSEMGLRWQIHKEPFGPAILQMEEVATRMGLRLALTPNTPFNRCLAMMRDGLVDLMWGLQEAEDRSDYMHLVPFRATSPKGFYILRRSGLVIEKFDDLRGLRVGSALGFRYFPRFDQEKDLFIKIEASSNARLFELLARERVDVVVMTELQADDILKRHPKLAEVIVHAGYRDASGNPVHLALSKKSRHANRVAEFRQAIDDMLRDDRFRKIREGFNEWYESRQ